jgi:broad specificity phosphatase PhoE
MGNPPTIVVANHGITPQSQMINRPPAKLEMMLENAAGKGASEADLTELIRKALKRNRQAEEDVPLASSGKGQCRQVKTWLENEGYNFRACFSSPYKRARESAKIIAGGHVVHKTYEQLSECDFGVFQDLPHELFYRFFPKEAKKRADNPLDWQPAGGKSLRSHFLMLRSVVQEALKRIQAGEHVLIVAHAGINIGMRALPELGNMAESLHKNGPGAWSPLQVRNGQTDLYRFGGPGKDKDTKPTFFRSVALDKVKLDTDWKLILR